MTGAYQGAEYVLAYVELDEGPRIITNIVDTEFDRIHVGRRVAAVFEPAPARRGTGALPRGRPVTSAATADGVSADAFVERARALWPALRERAARTEELRMLPPETVAEFHAADFFRGLQPERHGGLALDPAVFFEAVILIGTVCASSAWVLSVLGVHSWHLGLFDSLAQDDVWGADPHALICSSYATTGEVRRANGGYVLTGTWPFSSGSDHCRCILGGTAPARSRHAPAPARRRRPECGRTYARSSSRWRSARWSTTGSWPGCRAAAASRSASTACSYPSTARIDSWMCARVSAPACSGTRRLCSGCRSAACSAMRSLLRSSVQLAECTNRSSRGANRAQSALDRGRPEDVLLELRIARTCAQLDAATLQLRHNFANMTASIERGDPISMDTRSRCRWDAAHAAEVATECVDRVFGAAGGRAIFLSNPMQRAFRDAHAMRAHAFNNPNAAQVMGRAELGLPNREFLI